MGMKTVTICGSMKFAREMKSVAFALESVRGFNVLQCTYNDANAPLTEAMLENLAKAHMRKIDMSDTVYVVDVNGYMGDSVKREIEYARQRGKEIAFYSEDDLMQGGPCGNFSD